MLRGSWEPCQQMGLPEPPTKPANPSQAAQCAGPQPPHLPWDPEWSDRGHAGIPWSEPGWGVGAGRSGRGRRGVGLPAWAPGS